MAERGSRPSRAAWVFGLLFAIVGGIFAVGSWGAYLTDSEIERTGLRAEGLVLDKFVLRSHDGDSDFIVKYRFPLASGESKEASHTVSKGLWTGYRKGEPIEILYSSTNPNRNFPAGSGVTSIGLTAFISTMGALFAIFGAALLRGYFIARKG